jgi:hypothetical protein
MPLTLKTHEYKKSRGGSVLSRVNPYVRLSYATKGEDGEYDNHAPVYIQGGQYWSEGGAEIPTKELPSWLSAEVAKLSDKVKREVGLIK